MAKLKIYTTPSKVLRKRTQTVESIDSETKQNINDMLETLRSLPGYGIAAPQLGISKKIVIIENPQTTDEEGNIINEGLPSLILVNPKIVKFSSAKCEFEEGCFSVPDYRANITRPIKIRVEATNELGKKIKINTSGLLSRVLQHEIDHLDGILFIDYVTNKKDLIPNKPDESWQKMIATNEK